MKKYRVLRSGMPVQSFNTEEEARDFASNCAARNHTKYMVCEYINGILTEIETY